MSSPYKKISHHGKSVTEHRVIAEKILGRPLKNEECVHHVDGDGRNNSNDNLVICPNAAYHKFLHMRADAYDNSGNPDARQCYLCKKWDEQNHMSFISRGKDSFYYHKRCARDNYYENRDRILENRQKRRASSKRN